MLFKVSVVKKLCLTGLSRFYQFPLSQSTKKFSEGDLFVFLKESGIKKLYA